MTTPVPAGAARPGDERFTALFEAYAAAVHRYLTRRCSRPDADDLTAEVFLVAWRRLDDVPAEAALPWLYRTAFHVLANHRRRVVPLPIPDVPEPPADDEVADRVLDDLALQRAWLRLSPRDREVLRLAAWEGLDGAELAAALGIGVGGAGAALSRARQRLGAAWREESADDAAAGGGAGPATPA